MSDISVSFTNPFAGIQHASLEETVPFLMRQLGLRQDAGDAAFFLRQLNYVYQQSYDIEYPELKARKHIPIDTRVPAGAETYTWHQYDKQGQAKVVDDHAVDFPNVEVAGLEFGGKIATVGASYQYSLLDLQNSQKAGGMPLETRKSEATRRVMENKIEQIAWGGNVAGALPVVTGDKLPIYGLTNSPNVNTSNTTNVWTSSTVLTIIQDINKAAKTVFDNTKGIHSVNTMLLDTATWSYLATTPRSPTFTDDTMLQYILKQSPWIKTIDFVPFLDLAGKLQDGTSPGPRIALYDKSPDVLNLIMPMEFTQLPPQPLNAAFRIPCMLRTGGVNVYRPKAIVFMDGHTG